MEDEFLNPDPESKEVFRYQQLRTMFTYKTHINKDEIKAFFRKIGEYDEIYIAHEKGHSEEGYDHTHVLIKWKKIKDIKNAQRKFDIGEIHPNIKNVRTEDHWCNGLVYMMKEDLENEYIMDILKEKRPLADKVWDCGTVQDALRQYVKKPSDAGGIISLYGKKIRERKREKIEKEKRPVQELMYRLHLEERGDDRHVHWIYDEKGGSGKTHGCKMLAADFPKDVMIMRGASAKTQAYIVKNRIDEGSWNGKTYILDITRSTTIWDGFYTMIEQIKDGEFVSEKYESDTISLDVSPLLIVLSNELPQFRMMSLDRWIIWVVSDDRKIEHVETEYFTN